MALILICKAGHDNGADRPVIKDETERLTSVTLGVSSGWIGILPSGSDGAGMTIMVCFGGSEQRPTSAA